jgi:serine/threonine protein kinase/tetratricopeptide (TPR) repeat protein
MASTGAELGAFRLERELGRGGMGVVWRGAHVGTGAPVAIKAATGARNDRFAEAFEREVQSVAGLDHPGIVSVYDQGRVTPAVEAATRGALPAGSPYLVMELAELGDLSGLESPGWSHVRQILVELLEAMAHAHARGLVHLDLKPENVLVQRVGARGACVKISDFGLAFASADRRSQDHVHASGLIGTPAYMSPEQFEGRWRDYGPWTDLYALGCLAYELVEGRLPFASKSLIGLANAHMHQDVPRLDPRFEVPAELEAWIRALLAKPIEARFASSADALHALLELAGRARAPLTDRVFASSSPRDTGRATEIVSDDLAVRTLDSGMFAAATLQTGEQPAITREAPGAMAPAPAPTPRDWRGGALGGGGQTLPHLAGAGLGLWGLRAVPLAGREPERDMLWDVLWKASRGGGARAVVVRGPRGQGKTRLVEWFTRRARELGAAEAITVTHSARASAADGLPAAFHERFGLVGLRGEQARERVERVLGRVKVGAGGEVAWESRLWSNWLAPDDPNAPRQDPLQAVSLARRALTDLSRDRPIVLAVDDAQWATDALALTRAVLDDGLPEVRALAVLTVCDDDLVPDAPQRAALDEVCGHPRAVTIDLGVLDPRSHEHLIENLLGLSEDLTELVRRRTEGSPLFTVQLVHDMVARGLLVPSEAGYRLVEGAEVPIPDDVEALCLERLDHVVSTAASPHDALRAIELAAVLGARVRQDEWARACAAFGVPVGSGVVTEMVRAGLAWREREGWRFLNGMFVEALLARARGEDRLRTLHSACAAALEASADIPARRPRLIEHLVHAGRLGEAVHVFSTRVDQLNAPEAQRLFALLAPHADALDASDRVVYWCGCVGSMMLYQGHVQACREIADAYEPTDEVGEETRERWLNFDARIAMYEEDEARAVTHARAALEIAARLAVPVGVARATRILGVVLGHFGHHEEAFSHTRRALRMFEALDNVNESNWCRHDAAQQLMGIGRAREALALLEPAAASLRKGHDPVALMYVVECIAVAHYELGHLAHAATAFEESTRLSELQHDTGVWMSRENLARVYLKLGRHDDALALLERIDALPEAMRDNFYVNPVDDALLTCWAAQGRWDLYDARADAALAVDPDETYADGLDGLLALLLGRGEVVRAERVRWVAHQMWSALGDGARARATLDMS